MPLSALERRSPLIQMRLYTQTSAASAISCGIPAPFSAIDRFPVDATSPNSATVEHTADSNTAISFITALLFDLILFPALSP